jgi:antitoxin component of RelBE/YafQ-DinJ toxin-antitoxin module
MASDTTMVHVKVRTKTKRAAQQAAKKLGVSLSLVAEQAFRNFAANRQIVVEEPLTPTPYLEKILREAEKNRNNPKYWSGPFTGDEFVTHLRSLSKKSR